MPRGPKGQRRPADTVSNAILVAKIAVGDAEEDFGKAPGRARSGKAGGSARARALTREERQRIAKKAAAARWKK